MSQVEGFVENRVAFQISQDVDTILCDIEGTTTSISFVKDVLFPYIRTYLSCYLSEHLDSEECKQDVQLLLEQVRLKHTKMQDVRKLSDLRAEDILNFGHDQVATDVEYFGVEVPLIATATTGRSEHIESVVRNVLWQMDADRKAKPLKQLQGHMWKRAYEEGVIKGHVYDDVVPAFDRWRARGINICIYSSGSIAAQKLLFAYSEKGNMLHYFSNHFDTTSGLKVEVQSYHNILDALGKKANQVLFLTDMIKECDAATQAGISVCLIRREDNPDQELKTYQHVKSFAEII